MHISHCAWVNFSSVFFYTILTKLWNLLLQLYGPSGILYFLLESPFKTAISPWPEQFCICVLQQRMLEDINTTYRYIKMSSYIFLKKSLVLFIFCHIGCCPEGRDKKGWFCWQSPSGSGVIDLINFIILFSICQKSYININRNIIFKPYFCLQRIFRAGLHIKGRVKLFSQPPSPTTRAFLNLCQPSSVGHIS